MANIQGRVIKGPSALSQMRSGGSTPSTSKPQPVTVDSMGPTIDAPLAEMGVKVVNDPKFGGMPRVSSSESPAPSHPPGWKPATGPIGPVLANFSGGGGSPITPGFQGA